MDRLQEKNDLLFKLGMLLGPLQRLVDAPEQFDEQERAETMARYCAEYEILIKSFARFCKGEPGHNYEVEYRILSNALRKVPIRAVEQWTLAKTLATYVPHARAAIQAIPVPQRSVVLAAGSPFTTYCKLRELCEADATASLTWLDPFIGANVFHRFLANVPTGIPITLVSSTPSNHSGDQRRWEAFLDVSRLFAKERGPIGYRLVAGPKFHDRWIVFDEKRIYSLGGSSKDAGDRDAFTIAAVELTPENLATVQSHVTAGSELFGPNQKTHL